MLFRMNKERVKDQIAKDRAAFKKQAEEEKRLRLGETQSAESSKPEHVVRKDYNDAKLQMRLPGNIKIVHTFSAKESLSAVRLYMELNSNGALTQPFSISTTYPHKVFSEDDMEKSLQTLGLVPTAVLQAK